MESLTAQIVTAGRMMFERRLTDISGGNISAREGETVYMTPRYAGSRQHWRLSAEDILCGRLETADLLDHPIASREVKVHLAVYRAFPEAQAVIHAHPFHVLPFAAAGRSIEPVLENTRKYGTIGLTRYAPAHSYELAEAVTDALREKEENIIKNAGAVLIPTHGIVVVSKDLYTALDALERLDMNCWCLLSRSAVE